MHIATRLPDNIELGAIRRDTMDLDILRDDSGFEDVNQLWDQFLCEFEITYPLADRETAGPSDALTIVRNAFRATGGGTHSFELQDWADFEVEDEEFGLGDSGDATYQLIKTYSFGSLSHARIIQRPTGTIVIEADGIEVPSADYTIGNTGIVTFDTPADIHGSILTWTGEFNVPVRFDKTLQSSAITTNLEKYDTFVLIEKRLKATDFA